MNILKTLTATLLLAWVSLGSQAQDINWQAKAGLGWSTAFSGVSNIENHTGFHIGGGADIGLSANGVWHFNPTLQWIRKGWTFDGFYGNEQIMEAQYSTRLDYLQMPLQVAARLWLGGNCFLTIRTGCYVALGLSGKTNMEILNTNHEETFKINHFSESFDFNRCAYDKESRVVSYPKFNRWDAGAYGGIDLTFGHVVFGYDVAVGMTKLCDSGFIGNPAVNAMSAAMLGGHPKNIMFDLSLGYQF